MQKYQNISCSYYDQLEALATTKNDCSIFYNDGTEKIEHGIIIDLFAHEGAEYLKLNNNTVIRLDHIVSINGLPAVNIC